MPRSHLQTTFCRRNTPVSFVMGGGAAPPLIPPLLLAALVQASLQSCRNLVFAQHGSHVIAGTGIECLDHIYKHRSAAVTLLLVSLWGVAQPPP